jgi:hypothetical protein
VAAEWKLCGHLFLALENCGVSAMWWLRKMRDEDEDENIFEIYEEARQAVNISHPVPLACAQDIEVALLFYFWPSKVPTLAGGIAAVGQVWNTHRELTVKSWIRRTKLPSSEPINEAVEELREGRRVVIADTKESLWLVDSQLAARLYIAGMTAPPAPAHAKLVGSAIPTGIADGSLMKGIQ